MDWYCCTKKANYGSDYLDLHVATGINAILYYAPTIFADLGLSSNTVSLLATGVVGIVMLLATIPTLFYIDKLGRKPILTIGAIGMATW